MSSKMDTTQRFAHTTDGEEDRTTLRRKIQAIGLSKHYVWKWKPSHAFRELFQNVKDAMIETNDLDAENFHLVSHGLDSKGVYDAEARHPDTGSLLGYIRYQEKTGTLELVNFGADLPLSSLDTGYTTKINRSDLAGGHGEGYKLAALVMLRAGYAVHISASNYYWKFRWGKNDPEKLYCNIAEPSEDVLGREHADYNAKTGKGPRREKKAYVFADVKFTIGVYRGDGDKISAEDFRQWIKTTLDLHPPNRVIRGSKGGLILDPSYSNRIYLKGLLLERPRGSRRFKFGYDLNEGDVNRDRQWMEDPELVASNLAAIWEEASEEGGAKIVAEYVTMHQDTEQWADVDLSENHITRTFAQNIWQYLCVENSEKELFYHDSHHCDSDVEIIRRSLRKKPKQLSQSLWTPLQKYGLLRAPQQQQRHLLKTAADSRREETRYSKSVKWSLTAALALSKGTENLTLRFKSGATADLDLLLVDDILLINDKWLDFQQSHENAPCWLSRQPIGQVDTFSCLHVVTHLHDLVLLELTKSPDTNTGRTVAMDPSLSLKVHESLRQMPLMVTTVLTGRAGELKVSWSDSDHNLASVHGLDPKCRVTLHRESTCSLKRFDPLGQNGDEDPSRGVSPYQTGTVAECGCPHSIVSRRTPSAVFHHLDYAEKYFPMVARIDARALFGLPPEASSPMPPTEDSHGTATGPATFNLPARRSSVVSSLSETCGPDTEETINGNYQSVDDDSNSEHEATDTTNYLPASMSPSTSNALWAEFPMDTASYHRSMAPTPSTGLGGRPSAHIPIETENFRLKEELRMQRERIANLEQQLEVVNAKLQAQIELNASKDETLAELRARNERLDAELEHNLQKLARIYEDARRTPESEGRVTAGTSGTKRARISEGRNDTGCSIRAAKRPKEPSERNGDM